MKHIAVLFEFPTLNGGEHSMLAVLQRLRLCSDFRFTALAPPTGLLADQLKQLAIPHAAFSVRDDAGLKRPTPALLQHLKQVLVELSPDIVHANSLSMSRLLGQMGPDENRVRRTGHLRDIIRLKKQVIRDLNHNDALVAVSHATRSFHVAQGLELRKCSVIYNGVDTDLFRPRDHTLFRAELFPDIPEDATILLNVGQICLRKGQLNLAQSVCELLRQRGDVHLVVVGKRHSTKTESVEYEQQIQQKFQDVERSNHLHMLGHRSDINQLMNAADLLVHTAFQEPFGRVLLEASASGLPILATDVGGTSEMLHSGKEAMLVPPGDSTALLDALKQLINAPSLRTKLAAAARLRMESQFGLDTATTGLSDFWQSS